MKFCFGDIVVVDGCNIGVVVKCWEDKAGYAYDVYVRLYNGILIYREENVQRYMVRHKYLDDEELEYQKNAMKAGGWS